MKSIVYRISANHKILKYSQCLPFSTLSNQNPGSSYYNKRQEEEGRSVRVSVWWDFENCSLPLNTNVFRVAQGITNAIRVNGIRGPIQITAFGDVMQISRTNQEALSATGINLCHVPSGGKNSADRSLLVDLMFWVSENPPPAHIFLISGDRDFAGTLHKLRMSNYNILLASPDSAPNVLCSAATIMWQWSSLLKGDSLNGKLFNQPPDGPYNSWYGRYKASLEDPFAVVEQSSSSPTEESSELISESQVQPIPKAFRRLVRQILNSYPEGISISQLRTELMKCNFIRDKDLYGYRKLPQLLKAMPNDIKLHPSTKDQYIVKGVNTKLPNIGESETPRLNDGTSSGDDIDDNSMVPQIPKSKVKPELSNSQELQNWERQHYFDSSVNTPRIKVKAYSKSSDSKKEDKSEEFPPKRNTQEIQEQDKRILLQEQPKKIKSSFPVTESKDSSSNDENQVAGPNEVPASEYGIFRRTWMKWFASEDGSSREKSEKEREDTKNEKDTGEEKIAVSCESSKFICPALVSPSSHEALIDGKIPRGDVIVTDISSQGSSFLNKVTSWFKFWSSPEIDDKEEKILEAIDQVKVYPNQLELLSKASFWNELESFIGTSQGAALFTQSRTRDDLVQKLQKQGPLVFKSLSEGDLLILIDLLISHKKWVEECSSQAYPYRVVLPPGKVPSHNPPVGSNGLSHIFADGERKHQNPPHTGVQQNMVHRGSSSKPKTEMLADCRNLVDYIVKEHPEGINMGTFRKLFMEKNGYALDLQKLGYEKLVILLQTMPNIRIESNLLLPAGPLKGKISSSNKDDDRDSSFDELGPIDNSDLGKRETDAKFTKKIPKEKPVPMYLDYEPLNEQETPTPSECPKTVEDSSSLMQILDTWYNRDKGGNDKKGEDKMQYVNEFEENTDVDGSGTRTVCPGVVKNVKKHNKSPKIHSFVAEPRDSDQNKLVDEQDDKLIDDQGKLVDGILGSLKQSGKKPSNSTMLS